MLNRVTTTTTSAYQSVMGIFGSTAPQAAAPAPTRFKSAAELSSIAVILDKLIVKKDKLKKAADIKGAESNEFATFTLMDHFINLVTAEIAKFNDLPFKPDLLANYKEMHDLTTALHNIVVITPRQAETLNSITMDKPVIRSTVLKVGLLALPVIPVILLGPGAWAAALGVGGFFAMKPADDFLTSIKAIDWDTESKELLTDFIEVTKKANANLARYLELEEPHNNNAEAPPVMRNV
jgi:hypothetical protein